MLSNLINKLNRVYVSSSLVLVRIIVELLLETCCLKMSGLQYIKSLAPCVPSAAAGNTQEMILGRLCKHETCRSPFLIFSFRTVGYWRSLFYGFAGK